MGSTMHARGLASLVAVGLAACSSDGSRVVSDTSMTGPSSGTATTGGSTSTGAGTSTSMGADASSTGSSSGGGGLKLDVGNLADLGGADTGTAVPPTCANIDEFPSTSVGCEFWAAEVPSLESGLSYGISVGNPGVDPAEVVIEDLRGAGGTLREVATLTLAPGASELVRINGPGGVLAGEQHMIANAGLTDRGAFRITADVPVTAMQIFPVGGGPSHVAEASLLLPVNALDTEYLAVGYPDIVGVGGWIAVVATEDATTVTTVDGDVMLDAFDTWTFIQGLDATGYFVGADKRVAVFSGAACTLVPGDPYYACDHIEEQVVPLASWGEAYVAPRHPQRVPAINPTPEPVFWRIIGAVEGMTVTLDPPVAGQDGQVALADFGDFFQFSTAESFVATSEDPFMLVQYMSGCYSVVGATGDPSNCDQGATGDPYMIQVTPIEQWLTSLPFLTDTSYPRDFVMLMREAGTVVTLDCLGVVPDDHFVAIPGTGYEVGSVDLDLDGLGGEGDCVDGQQYISASAPIGVLVAGVDWATSYGYPGGMSLGALWTPPEEPPG